MPSAPLADFASVHQAIKAGHRRRAAAAIHALPRAVLEPEPHPGASLLLEAIRSREWPLATSLLERGVSPNTRGEPQDDTPLMAACRAHRLDWVRVLLNKGADPAAVPLLGEGVLHAVLGGRSGRVHEAREQRFDPGVMAHIDRVTHELFVLLLAAGAPVNGHPSAPTTPLMQTAQRNFLPLMELLLERGADPNQANTVGNTAFLFAARDAAATQDPEVLLRLLDAGADPALQNHKGEGAEQFYDKEVPTWAIRGITLPSWREFYSRLILSVQMDRTLPSPARLVARQRL